MIYNIAIYPTSVLQQSCLSYSLDSSCVNALFRKAVDAVWSSGESLYAHQVGRVVVVDAVTRTRRTGDSKGADFVVYAVVTDVLHPSCRWSR